MSIKVKCDHCGTENEVSSGTAGTTDRCSKCWYQIVVPGETQMASVTPQVPTFSTPLKAGQSETPAAATGAGSVNTPTSSFSATGSAPALRYVAIGIFALVIGIHWLGWITFISIVLGIVVVVAALTALGFGVAALGPPKRMTGPVSALLPEYAGRGDRCMELHPIPEWHDHEQLCKACNICRKCQGPRHARLLDCSTQPWLRLCNRPSKEQS